jgi:hypothetical protein
VSILARRNRISYHPERPRQKCRSCGKTIFASDVDAKNFLATLQRTPGAVPIRPYYDNGCQAWHLTSQPR